MVKDHQDILCAEFDTPDQEPIIAPTYICFNGKDDEGHETFSIDVDDPSWDFCKTACKPYDIAVCKILLLLACHYGSDHVRVTSDGFAEIRGQHLFDGFWVDALAWVKSLGKYDLRSGLPDFIPDEAIESPTRWS